MLNKECFQTKLNKKQTKTKTKQNKQTKKHNKTKQSCYKSVIQLNHSNSVFKSNQNT